MSTTIASEIASERPSALLPASAKTASIASGP